MALATNVMAKKRIPSLSRSLHRFERPGVMTYFGCQTDVLPLQSMLRLTRPIVVMINTTASRNIADSLISDSSFFAHQSSLTVEINDVQMKLRHSPHNASSGSVVEVSLDGGDREEGNPPLAQSKNGKWNHDQFVLVPDRKGSQHEKCGRSGDSGGRVRKSRGNERKMTNPVFPKYWLELYRAWQLIGEATLKATSIPTNATEYNNKPRRAHAQVE